MVSKIDGPDFICVGMPKAGTGWLFDQLQFHPDFWMAPIKGFHYLDSKTPSMRNAERKLKRLLRRPEKPLAGRRAGDERDLAFLKEAVALGGKRRDLKSYAALFRHKGDRLSGDITAPYAGVQEDAIAEVNAVIPEVKIVCLVREPISRLWSNVSMSYRGGRLERPLLDDPPALLDFIMKTPMYKFAFASRVANLWAENAPKVQFRPFLFDDIEGRPDKARRDILTYVGADPAKDSGTLAAGHNRKATSEKLTLTDEIRKVLVDHFADEVRECARLFGGRAKEWPGRYGL
jgi:hypothetical protein